MIAVIVLDPYRLATTANAIMEYMKDMKLSECYSVCLEKTNNHLPHPKDEMKMILRTILASTEFEVCASRYENIKLLVRTYITPLLLQIFRRM